MQPRHRRRRTEDVDIWCRSWAYQRRFALGIEKHIEPWELLGQMRCTLNKVREDKVAAGYSTKLSQQFPEVYRGDCLITHLGIMHLPPGQKLVIHLHYVWEGLGVIYKAPTVPTSETGYWELLRAAKIALRNYVQNFLPSPEIPIGAVQRMTT